MDSDVPAMALDQDGYTLLVADALQKDFGQGRNAIKRIAAAANSNIKAAKNWYYGVNAPGGLHLLRLMAHSPTLASEARRLAAMESNMDPAFERAMHQAVSLFMRLPRPEQDAAMRRMARAEGAD